MKVYLDSILPLVMDTDSTVQGDALNSLNEIDYKLCQGGAYLFCSLVYNIHNNISRSVDRT